MKLQTNPQDVTPASIHALSSEQARAYITDMLVELCAVAKQSANEDLHILLKLASQAAHNTVAAEDS